MRISDWSSDVCSSDLEHGPIDGGGIMKGGRERMLWREPIIWQDEAQFPATGKSAYESKPDGGLSQPIPAAVEIKHSRHGIFRSHHMTGNAAYTLLANGDCGVARMKSCQPSQLGTPLEDWRWRLVAFPDRGHHPRIGRSE